MGIIVFARLGEIKMVVLPPCSTDDNFLHFVVSVLLMSYIIDG